MAKKEDVMIALNLLQKSHPDKTFHNVANVREGFFAVIKSLAESETPLTSKEICEKINVSSARMTILLKKLEQKDLIIKTKSEKDARAVYVSLSEKGNVFVMRIKENLYNSMEQILDEIGIEEFTKLFNTLERIKTILHETRPLQLEDDYV